MTRDTEHCRHCGGRLDAEPSWYNVFLHKRCFDERRAERLRALAIAAGQPDPRAAVAVEPRQDQIDAARWRKLRDLCRFNGSMRVRRLIGDVWTDLTFTDVTTDVDGALADDRAEGRV